MSTPIQPVPDAVLASEFPTPADRPAGAWNQKAADWANSENAMVLRAREIAVVTHNNAVAAEERADAADTSQAAAATSATAAANSASTADSHRVAAANSATEAADSATEAFTSEANAATSAAQTAADRVQTGQDRQAVADMLESIEDGPVTSVNEKTGVVVLNKSDIGLGNVDNTADADKPISTEAANAFAGKANTDLSNVSQSVARNKVGTGTMAYRAVTISTAGPVGGSNGDFWVQVDS